ncbi:MAG: flagellar hook-length control protein FliK [Lachnospiraceae bacterium]|nr:flagellar hook-length control protein FliK [Lachnospiraceae bacterium]
METAVKMQTMTSAKTQMTGRQVSLEASVKNGDFTKLLQAKKDLADSAEQTGQTEAKKPGEDTVKAPSKEKPEDSKAPVKEEEENLGQQEALQQAVLMQAAVQVVEALGEEPEIVEETMTEMLDFAEPVDGLTEAGENMPVFQDETKGESVLQEMTPVAVEKPPEESQPKPVANQPQESVAGEMRISDRTDAKGQEREKDLTGSKEGQTREEPKVQNSQELYSGASFRASQTEHIFRDSGRAGEIPLRTTPQTLPEDLGKTLAARFPDTGKTLTVELEPASLGKLTIHMTYEAGRAAVSIMATNPKTLELLSEKVSEIAAILEEKTGQNTVVLTQQPQEQEQYQENKDGTANQGESRQQEQHQKEEKGQHSDSFAQQLRLGLV